MAKWGNLDGTLRHVFNLGKNNIEVGLRNNGGILQGKNNAGAWSNILGQSPGYSTTTENANFTASFGSAHIVTSSVNVQLPAPVANSIIKIKTVGSLTLTFVRNGSEKIENVASNFVSSGSENEAFEIITDGTDWFIL